MIFIYDDIFRKLHFHRQVKLVRLDSVFYLNSFNTVSCNMTQQNYHIYDLFILTFHGRVSVFPWIPYNIKSVQR
jgi:hypothetical protein